MPIVITYDISKATANDHNRVQSLFERFGWENLGGSSYRYPTLGSTQPTEDWFNHVVPALMLFRTFILKIATQGKQLKKFTIDVQSSTGLNPQTEYGTPPQTSATITLYPPSNQQFGKKKLDAWLDGTTWPY